jgi:hypothetical protein
VLVAFSRVTHFGQALARSGLITRTDPYVCPWERSSDYMTSASEACARTTRAFQNEILLAFIDLDFASALATYCVILCTRFKAVK